MSQRTDRNAQYDAIHKYATGHGVLREALRELCKTDLFYLLTRACYRRDIDRDWLFDRCLEVQQAPNDHLDLWAREHYKSTIITFGLTIQNILCNPEITVGIFSHTKPIARAFLRQIKYELETNEQLRYLFPEIIWESPKRDAPNAGAQWSEDKGITVKRSTNPKECTVEAHGLVDGQPTSKHYSLLIYDDVVTLESITSPEMMKKTTDALALSYNLGAAGGARRCIGTRYHYNDTYATLIERGTFKQRIKPATIDGTFDGVPVLLDRETLSDKRRDMGPYVYACQMLQNPKADSAQGFDESWLRYYGHSVADHHAMNTYILVDPANEKRKMNDYTTMMVIGIGADNNYYWLDGIRDRLNLTERTEMLFALHRKWSPDAVGYEKYGMQADIQHIEYVQRERSYHFNITELGGQTPKNDRIRRLVPVFEQGRFYFPVTLPKRTAEGAIVDILKIFIDEEYKAFPVMAHDDMLDCMARILDDDLNTFAPMQMHSMRHSTTRVLKSLR